MKTKEELNALKEEFEALNEKLAGLTEEEMEQIVGGGHNYWLPKKPSEDGGIIGGGKWPYSKEGTDSNSWGPHWGEY